MSARGRFLALGPNVQGAGWMLVSAVTFVAMTTLVKSLGTDYPAPLQNFYRQLGTLLVVAPFVLRAPRAVLASRRMPALLFRAGCSMVGVILQLYSFQTLPMAEANALSFTRPLWIVPLAILVLREAVNLPRLAAVVVGFCGVLLMLHPWSAGAAPGLPQAAALASSFVLALSITGMKSLTQDHSPLTVLAWASILGVILSLPSALLVWRWPGARDLMLLTALGLFAAVNQWTFIKGMSVGDATAMAPLDYTRLLFAIAAGYVFFGEIPTALTLAGAAVIMAATLFITWREQQLARRARIAAALGEGVL